MNMFLLGSGILVAMALSYLLNSRRERDEKRRALAHLHGRPSLTPAGFGRHYLPPEQAEVAAQVAAIFAKHLDLDVSQAHPDDKLVADLRMDALDSMATVEFIIDLETHFGMTIPDRIAGKMRTLRDVIEFITQAVHPLPR